MKEIEEREVEESNVDEIERIEELVTSLKNREFALKEENNKLRRALVILIKSANKKTLRKVLKELS